MSKAKAAHMMGVPLITIALALLGAILALLASASSNAYGQSDGGSLTVTVFHTDGSRADSADFSSDAYAQRYGQFALYPSDGSSLIGEYPTCNYSGGSCEITDIPAGKYSVVISLTRYLSPEYQAYQAPVDSLANEYTTTFSVQDGVKKEVKIVVDYGYVETTIVKGSGAIMDPSGFASLYISESGYYSIYNDEGEPVVDAAACNIGNSSSCKVPLGSGIYEARVVSADNTFPIYKAPFEVIDNHAQQAKVMIGASSGGAGSTEGSNTNQGGSGSNNNPGSNTGSGSSADQSIEIVPPSPQEVSIPLAVHSHFIDSEGTYHLVGEVQNNGTYPLSELSVSGVFYGDPSMKNVLTTKRGYPSIDELGSGGRSPFEILVKDNGVAKQISNYTLTTTALPLALSSTKPASLGVNITSYLVDNATGSYRVLGEVVNYGQAEARFVKVVLIFYDEHDNIVYTFSKYTNSHLEPRAGVARFEILCTPPMNSSSIARVSALVQSLEYSMVPGGLITSPIQITLDSTAYDSGMGVRVNGTVGATQKLERYAIIDIVWPDGVRYDRQTALVSPENGSYARTIMFYSSYADVDQTFTVRVFYANSFAESHFVFKRG